MDVIYISEIEDRELRESIAIKILSSLSDYFDSDKIAEIALLSSEKLFFAAFVENIPIAFAAIKIHNRFAAELVFIAVTRHCQRSGIASTLLEFVNDYCRSFDIAYITVKLPDPSAVSDPLFAVLKFFLRNFFVPLEVLTFAGEEEQPSLFMVKRVFEFL